MPRKKKETATLVRQDDVAPVFVLGDVLEIDAPATKSCRLIVAEIRQYAVGSVGPMVDYVLNGDPRSPQIRLRFLRCENALLRPLALTLYDSLAYNEGLLAVVRDDTAKLIIHDDTNPANIAGNIFWRIYDVTDSHISSVNIRSKIGVTNAVIEYWDYSRLSEIDGIETEEFIFVEMNKESGWFESWRGIEVVPGRIVGPK
ncbi:MAG: hypothetical protein JSS02_02475 [Planctomycetes bacterium]|nr:hypothetical protein [Planctomycetota bacterium]